MGHRNVVTMEKAPAAAPQEGKGLAHPWAPSPCAQCARLRSKDGDLCPRGTAGQKGTPRPRDCGSVSE